MVFCGRPSKACQRCRDRRLKCDLHTGFCGQCVRAKVACSGYRDTQQLRIRNESQAVRKKALSRTTPHIEPRSIVLSLELQAREAFFAHHVIGTSRTWGFLEQFYDPTHSPKHLTLSIDAVSLAYLAQQVYSNAALATAREKYISALHMTNKALQSPQVMGDTTLLASLLLDLFEKITNHEPLHNKSWAGHVNGALALVKLRGLENLQDPLTLRVLVRLSTNLLISCVASETSVPEELIALRAHAGRFLNIKDPKWQLSDLMVHYANLRSDIRRGNMSVKNCISVFTELDAKLQALALNMPPSWQYKTTSVDPKTEMIYNGHFDSYPDRHITQTWNVLRLVRILIKESILGQCLETARYLEPGACSLLIRMTKDNIETLACEICASVPQYVACHTTLGRLPVREGSEWSKVADCSLYGSGHLHSPSRNLDCYTLIFPLYVAGRSRGAPSALKSWVIKQLHVMNSHFGIRNAALVCRILEEGTDINPWAVYAMLGSYAFVA